MTARSGFPSLLKSATTTLPGLVPTVMVEAAKVREAVGLVTVNGTAFDAPPPGAGLVTVIEAVVAVAIFAAGTAAVSWSWFTNVVVSGVPFQFTTEFAVNKVPLTVKVNAAPPAGV